MIQSLFRESFQITTTAMLEDVCAIFRPTEDQMELFHWGVSRAPSDIYPSFTGKSITGSQNHLSDCMYYSAFKVEKKLIFVSNNKVYRYVVQLNCGLRWKFLRIMRMI